MITGGATEQVLHFIGYLHLDELLNKTTITYSGAYAPSANEEFAYGPAPDLEAPEGVLPGKARLLRDDKPRLPETPLRVDPDIRLEAAPQKSPEIFELVSPSPGGGGYTNSSSSGAANFVRPPRFEIDAEVQITVSYTLGGDQFLVINVDQANWMIDNDTIFQNALQSAAANVGLVGSDELIAAAGENVGEAHSTDFSELMSELIETAQQHIGSAAAHDPSAPPHSGRHRDGQKDHPHDDSDDADDGFSGAHSGQTPPEDHAGAGDQHGNTPAALEVAEVPTGGPAQSAVLGENTAINVASVIDLSDGWGSIIVKGNYHEKNVIVQTNILHDNDYIEFSGSAFIQQAITGNNDTSNEAEITSDNSVLFGNSLFGNLPVGVNWHVDYVQGNYYDLTTIEQSNELVDNDINVQTSASAHFTLSMGENNQFNFTEIFNWGKQYDLIIVEGNYYEFNAIIQTNIVLDDDFLGLSAWNSQIGDDSEEGSNHQSADAGSNELLNDATITNIGGGDQFNSMTAGAASLADQIGSRVGELELESLFPELGLLPGSGGGVFEVLYVSGDFYEYKSIEQTNMIVDVDTSDQNTDSSEPGSVTQDVSSGGNTAWNVAVIVDVDSTSNYQYLGGNYYEDEMLVKANITTDDDDISFGEDEFNVAAVTTLLNNSDGTSDGPNDISSEPLPNNLGDDVVGGVLS